MNIRYTAVMVISGQFQYTENQLHQDVSVVVFCYVLCWPRADAGYAESHAYLVTCWGPSDQGVFFGSLRVACPLLAFRKGKWYWRDTT